MRGYGAMSLTHWALGRTSDNSVLQSWSFNMVLELGLTGGPRFESSPYNLIPHVYLKVHSPRAWVWGHVHVREGVEA